ncbi:MAG: rhomboid family intramembrane serine protease, partial [Leptospiraceae bacterium]|nr:rhomboid family intramembrane serine protease [Leptospiraceae bacterium]
MFQSSKLPLVTRSILYATVGVHLYVVLFLLNSGSAGWMSFYERFGLIPSAFLEGAFWQPLTSIFLHGVQGPMLLMHITFNMIGVVSIGVFLERAIGSLRFAFLYLVSGIAGGLAVVLMTPDLSQPTVGASGALSGLIGAL